MNDYKNAVEYLASSKTNDEFDNKGAVHAAIVLSNMLKYAKKDFKIFSGTFNGDVTHNQDFLKALNDFIVSGRTFKLILEKIPEEDDQSSALKKVIEYAKQYPNTVKYKIATPDFLNNLKKRFKSGNAYHFAVADNMAFRIETVAIDYKAICNFNDAEIAKKLTKTFDDFL